MPDAPPALVRQALDNLVNQFANPYDFLRELVQNAIDAGTPRVEVWTRYRADAGVLELHVDDFGAGMDEAVIDGFFTRLFASTKEDDLSKIGRFGIGFTSVFAIAPEAVLVRTGRHGESWELLFHADRSFDKVRLREPISGTRVTLFKRMDAAEARLAAAESLRTLRWWCEHCDTPILFSERDADAPDSPQAPSASADPFADFVTTDDKKISCIDSNIYQKSIEINQKFSVESDLFIAFSANGVEGIIGYTDQPRYAFYNGGLTLLNTRSAEALGEFAETLSHLCFKVKSRSLEHTLTRDNVIQDEGWARVMGELVRAADALFERLVERAEAALQSGLPLDEHHARLAVELGVPGAARRVQRLRDRALFRDANGTAVRLAELERAEDREGALLLVAGPPALRRALDADGVLLIEPTPSASALLARCLQAGGRRSEVEIRPAEEVYALAEPDDAADAELSALVAQAGALLRRAAGWRLGLRLVALHGARGAFAVLGPAKGGLFRLGSQHFFRRFQPRTLLLNRAHPELSVLALLYRERPRESAWMLAHTLLVADGADNEDAFRRLGEAAAKP